MRVQSGRVRDELGLEQRLAWSSMGLGRLAGTRRTLQRRLRKKKERRRKEENASFAFGEAGGELDSDAREVTSEWRTRTRHGKRLHLGLVWQAIAGTVGGGAWEGNGVRTRFWTVEQWMPEDAVGRWRQH